MGQKLRLRLARIGVLYTSNLEIVGSIQSPEHLNHASENITSTHSKTGRCGVIREEMLVVVANQRIHNGLLSYIILALVARSTLNPAW